MRQFDLFVPVTADLPLRDQRDTMERPFFSLSKTKRLSPINYISPDGEIRVNVFAHPEFGMATIWDADVLIWAASVLMAKKRRRLEATRTLRFQPYDLLRAIGRGTGGTEYRLLRQALARLQATVVKTNIRAQGQRKGTQFGWIEGWTDTTDEATGQSRGMTLTVSGWFYEGVMMDGGVLAIDPAYFAITSGRERWLYRVARKHAGGHDENGFAISLHTLFAKSGVTGDYRRFVFELRQITDRNTLPGYHLSLEEPQAEGGGTRLRMTKRSALDSNHSAHELPRQRRRGGPRRV